jgi:hypothetical protein
MYSCTYPNAVNNVEFYFIHNPHPAVTEGFTPIKTWHNITLTEAD